MDEILGFFLTQLLKKLQDYVPEISGFSFQKCFSTVDHFSDFFRIMWVKFNLLE